MNALGRWPCHFRSRPTSWRGKPQTDLIPRRVNRQSPAGLLAIVAGEARDPHAGVRYARRSIVNEMESVPTRPRGRPAETTMKDSGQPFLGDLDVKRTMLLVLAFLCCAAVSQAQTPTRILFVGTNKDHGYGEHMYMEASTMLAKCVERTPGVEGLVSKGWPMDPKLKEKIAAVVVYSTPAAELLLGGKDREEVESVLNSGAGLVTIHFASSINKENVPRIGPLWLKYMGGTWVSSNRDLSSCKAPLKLLIPDHPIGRGWKEFEISDEVYLNPTLTDAKPLLQVNDRKGTDVVVGWVHERQDNGRTFATTLGHSYRLFEDASFRRMLVNGILWASGREVPETGADVNVPAEILELPKRR
jgi:type 1 glutamine amidotransferase